MMFMTYFFGAGVQCGSDVMMEQIIHRVCPGARLDSDAKFENFKPVRLDQLAPLARAAREVGLEQMAKEYGPGSAHFDLFKTSTVDSALAHYRKMCGEKPTAGVRFRVKYRYDRMVALLKWSGISLPIQPIPGPLNMTSSSGSSSSGSRQGGHGGPREMYTCTCRRKANVGCTNHVSGVRQRLCTACCKRLDTVCHLKRHNA